MTALTDRLRRVLGSWRGRAGEAVHTARNRPLAALGAVLSFAARWALRIGLPILGAITVLTLFPYRASAGGVRFRIEATLFARPGFSADTTFGSWEFPHVSALPVGVHVSPVDVDLVRMAAAASPDPQAYADQLRDDLSAQAPAAIAWLLASALLGALAGAGVAAAIGLAVRYLRRQPPRPDEARHRLRQLGAGLAVCVVVAGIGVLTYNPHWVRRSRVTGTVAALQTFPGQLQQYYTQRSKALDVLSAVAAIQSGLQQRIDQADSEPAAFNIMFISDMHLASTYPLVAQYARNFDVSLIVNTGDESEFGTRAEMTPSYLAQMRRVTEIAPMVWLAGNHDSPDTVAVMRTVPGVIVLGTKVQDASGGYRVTAQQINAYGLTIAAVPDPRVYGGPGAYGSNDNPVTDELERSAVDKAVAGIPSDKQFDIFATHEPVAAEELERQLPGRIRQLNSGHLHQQNSDADIDRSGSPIFLVEGSTGAGGLDNLNRGVPAPPVEFSIESVGSDCQFTKIVRFQISGTTGNSADDSGTPGTNAGSQVSASTDYFTAQHLAAPRECSTALGLGPVSGVG